MKKILIILLILCTTLSFSKTAIGVDKNEEFNVTDMIMHHIKDSHEFHVLDWNGKAFSIPLPIVLWTDNGLVTFMSSEFNHDDNGEVIVSKKNQSFVKFHEKIFYASDSVNASNQYLTLDESSYPTNNKPLDFSITKLVFSMFLSMLILILIFGFSARNYNKSSDGLPSGIAKFTEPLILFVRDEVAIPNIGEKKL